MKKKKGRKENKKLSRCSPLRRQRGKNSSSLAAFAGFDPGARAPHGEDTAAVKSV